MSERLERLPHVALVEPVGGRQPLVDPVGIGIGVVAPEPWKIGDVGAEEGLVALEDEVRQLVAVRSGEHQQKRRPGRSGSCRSLVQRVARGLQGEHRVRPRLGGKCLLRLVDDQGRWVARPGHDGLERLGQRDAILLSHLVQVEGEGTGDVELRQPGLGHGPGAPVVERPERGLDRIRDQEGGIALAIGPKVDIAREHVTPRQRRDEVLPHEGALAGAPRRGQEQARAVVERTAPHEAVDDALRNVRPVEQERGRLASGHAIIQDYPADYKLSHLG